MRERINLVKPINAIGQIAIMIERIQPCIVLPHRATMKRSGMIGIIDTARPDSQYNIGLIRNRWVKCLAVAEETRSWTALWKKLYCLARPTNLGMLTPVEKVKGCRYWNWRSNTSRCWNRGSPVSNKSSRSKAKSIRFIVQIRRS